MDLTPCLLVFQLRGNPLDPLAALGLSGISCI